MRVFLSDARALIFLRVRIDKNFNSRKGRELYYKVKVFLNLPTKRFTCFKIIKYNETVDKRKIRVKVQGHNNE